MWFLAKYVQVTGKYEDEDESRPTATEELAGYLWDNYIEYAIYHGLESMARS